MALEGHDTLDSAVVIIAPAEVDFFAVEGDEVVVGYGHAVGNGRDKRDSDPDRRRWLGIDVPILASPSFASSCSNQAR